MVSSFARYAGSNMRLVRIDNQRVLVQQSVFGAEDFVPVALMVNVPHLPLSSSAS
jgi:hypothetical protein